MKRLTSVIRRPQGIFALVSDLTEQRERPFTEHFMPLASVDETVCPWRDRDVAAWRSLARVPNMSRRAGLAIVRSLIASVSDPEQTSSGALAMDFTRGPVDLRPHLCNAHTETAILAALEKVLDEVSGQVAFPEWHWHRRFEISELPAAFRREFLWGLHLSSWDMVGVTLELYESMGLERDTQLRRGVSRLLSYASRERGVEWCEKIAALAPRERLESVQWLLSTESFERAPRDVLRPAS